MTRKPPPALSETDIAGEAGWTLLELLVGLVLLSLITVLLTQSLRTGRNALVAVERQSSEVTVEVVQSYLRRAITQARLVRLPDGRSDAPLIAAEPQQLQFVTAYVPAGQYGGLYTLALALQPAARGGGFDLVETRTLLRPPPRPGAPEPARPQLSSTLLRNLADLKLGYFGLRDEENAAQWGTDWRSPAHLPRLIAVEVTFAKGDRRHWPPLIIAPAAGQ